MKINYHDEFQKMLDDQGVQYFDASEILAFGMSHADPGHPGFGLNELPPVHLWPNIVATVKAADKIRERLGCPVYILSAYRSEAYNKAVGGSPGSKHKRFKALDLECPEKGATAIAHAAKAEREAGTFSGGVGRYRWGVHIDAGERSRDWSYI